MISVRTLVKTLKPQPLVCDCCRRTVDKVRGSMWHGAALICLECFYQWYDPDSSEIDSTDPVSIGNYVRRKHGLSPLNGGRMTHGTFTNAAHALASANDYCARAI